MKRLICIVLMLALLCGAAFAEAAHGWEAALEDALELALTGEFDDFEKRVSDKLQASANAQQIYAAVRMYGEPEGWEMTVSTVREGNYFAEFIVTQGGRDFIYTIGLNGAGEYILFNMQVAQEAAAQTETDGNIDFQKLAEETFLLLMNGEYGEVIARVTDDMASTVTEDRLKETVTMYGEADLYMYTHLQIVKGYHAAVFEVRQDGVPYLYEMVFDGAGKLAGFHVNPKASDDEMFADDAEKQQWQQKGEAYMQQLLDGGYDAVYAQMSESLKAQLTAETLSGMFAQLSGHTGMELYDLMQSNGYVTADIIVDYPETDMLFRFGMNGEGQLEGIGFYEVKPLGK